MKMADYVYEDNHDDLFYEPESCDYCEMEMEEMGIEYTLDYYVEDGVPYCEHCGRPL